MTNRNLLPLLVILTACGDATPRPVKVFDFSGGEMDAPAPLVAPPAGPLGKGAIRHAIQSVQPRLRACALVVTGPATGTLELRLHLTGEPGAPTEVDAVELGGDSALARSADFASCAEGVLAAIELPAMTAPEVWDVHYPLVVR